MFQGFSDIWIFLINTNRMYEYVTNVDNFLQWMF